MERKVITSHVFPPIPVRCFDWCAWFDDLGADESPYGWLEIGEDGEPIDGDD